MLVKLLWWKLKQWYERVNKEYNDEKWKDKITEIMRTMQNPNNYMGKLYGIDIWSPMPSLPPEESPCKNASCELCQKAIIATAKRKEEVKTSTE